MYRRPDGHIDASFLDGGCDDLLPSQMLTRQNKSTVESRLAGAVLEDAVSTVRKYYFVPTANSRNKRYLKQDLEWLFAHDFAPFSVESCCAILDIDVDYLRSTMRSFMAGEHKLNTARRSPVLNLAVL